MSRRAKRILLALVSVSMLLVLLGTAVVLLLRSAWLHEKIRQKIVTEIEKATGGEVALGGFTVDWRSLKAEVRHLVIRGKEPFDEQPLVRVRSVTVGLKFISFWTPDIDIASLDVDEPFVNIIVNADGTTNFPGPKVKRQGKPIVETLLNLAIGRFTLESGTFIYSHKRTKFSFQGRNLKTLLTYNPVGPVYQGTVSIQPAHLVTAFLEPFDADVKASVTIDKQRIDVTSATLAVDGSRFEANGSLADLASPKGTFDFAGDLSVKQFARLARFPFLRDGTAAVKGRVLFGGKPSYSVSAAVDARRVDFRQGRVHIENAQATVRTELTPELLEVSSISATALGGQFNGRATIERFARYSVEGDLRGFDIQRGLAAAGSQIKAWSGTASGPVRLNGTFRNKQYALETRLAIAPAAGATPIEGLLDVRYDSRRQVFDLARSWMATSSTRVDVSGAVGSEVRVRLGSTNLDDAIPAINLFSNQPVTSLPLRLAGGRASFEGTVKGPLSSPVISGRAFASNLEARGNRIDQTAADFSIGASAATVRRAVVEKGKLRAQGSGSIDLVNWKPTGTSALAATVTLRDAEVAELLRMAGRQDVKATGVVGASGRLSGTYDDLRLIADFNVSKGQIFEEPFDSVKGRLGYTERVIALRDTEIIAGPARVTVTGAYRHVEGDLRNGQLRFDVSTNEMPLARVAAIQRRQPNLAGNARLNFNGAAAIRSSATPPVLLTSLNGDIAARQLQLEGRQVGGLAVTARTEQNLLKTSIQSDFLDSSLQGTAQWRLEPDYPGQGELIFSRLSLAALRNWVSPAGRDGFRFDGSLEGKAQFAGPASKPETWTASVELANFEVFPLSNTPGATPPIRLRNEGPIKASLDRSVVKVSEARLTGRSTQLDIGGSVALQPRPALDLKVNGMVDLSIADGFDPDIHAGGAVVLNANIRGPFQQPQVNGRMELKGASLNFADVTTGLANANGLILFSGTRASIEELKAEVGGGTVSAAGFVGFETGASTFRVKLNANEVRVRYPAGASTTFNADLTLSGTTQRSFLAGEVTILRTGFNPRTDLASILAGSAEPVRTPAARTGPLSGLQFDIKIESAPNIAVESAIAQDVQAEVDLRLRGTPYNPVLLGRILVTQGEVMFFGTKYNISQGAINFINPVKLEPILNMDLETKVRGVDVTITLSGPINKLNVTHRADPPIDFNELVALLATGRTPTSDPALLARQTTTQPQNFSQLGASTLVSQALAAPLSSRLQRFFGVSKLKIDPAFTGVENRAQARITLEQQVTRDITFTYITDVTRSNPQIIRIDWALNRQWSVLGLREENGLFSIEFLYRKSFK